MSTSLYGTFVFVDSLAETVTWLIRTKLQSEQQTIVFFHSPSRSWVYRPKRLPLFKYHSKIDVSEHFRLPSLVHILPPNYPLTNFDKTFVADPFQLLVAS